MGKVDVGRRRLLQASVMLPAAMAMSPFIGPASPVHAAETDVGVPLRAQGKNALCGRTCVWMVLHKFGFEIGFTESRVADRLPEWAHILDIRDAIYPLSSEQLEGKHLKTSSKHWQQDVESEFDADYPVIALISRGKNIGLPFDFGHYIVLRGYGSDRNGSYVIYNDPYDGKRKTMSYSKFAEAWGQDWTQTINGDQITVHGWQAVTFWPTEQ